MKNLHFLYTLVFLFFQLSISAQDVVQSTQIEVQNRTSRGIVQTSMSEVSTAQNSLSEDADRFGTQGQLDVDLAGAATYNFPIKAPSGINGVTPDISIGYSSRNGNGVAGFGWNINGVSNITRIPSTKYHDGNIDPVDFDEWDRFALNGQRLILKSGTYGASGATYETENHSNLKITSVGTSTFGANYGPKYFKVNYPDGSIAYFGVSSNSRSRMDFAITRWENPQGIAIEYTYILENNTLSISAISYGHKYGNTAPNKIEFVYDDRTRREQSFTAGISFYRKNILKEIRVKTTGNTPYRNYILKHNQGTAYQTLVSITEESGSGIYTYSDINFGYSRTDGTIGSTELETTLSLSNIESRNSEMVPLDFTGNGKMDFIIYPKNANERNKYWLFTDLQEGGNTIGSQVNTTSFETMFATNYLLSSNKLSKSQGVVTVTNSGSSSVKFKVLGKSGSSPISQQYEKTWTAPSYTYSDYCGALSQTLRVGLNYLSGDFNGDGLTDVIAIGKPYSYTDCKILKNGSGQDCDGDGPIPIVGEDGSSLDNATVTTEQLNNGDCCQCITTNRNASAVYFINLDRRVTSNFANTAGYLTDGFAIGDKYYLADANGDGKTDLIHVQEGKLRVYGFNNTNGIRLLWTTTDSRIKREYPLYLGDYNGDGKTDFVVPTEENSSLFAMFSSTGTGFSKKESNYPFTFKLSTVGTSPTETNSLIATDVNGDNRTDFLEYETMTSNNGANGSQKVTIFSNNGHRENSQVPLFYKGDDHTISGTLNHFPLPVFLNSIEKNNDNLDFATISNNRIFYFTFGKNNREDMLLRSVNQNGMRYDIDYRNLASTETGLDNTLVYLEKSDQVFPYVDLGTTLGTKVVVGIERHAAFGQIKIKQTYSYMGGVGHTEGLGFMGFEGVARSEWHTDATDRIWNIAKNDIQKRAATTLKYQIPNLLNFNSVPSDYITKTNYTYSHSLSTNKVFKIAPTTEVIQNRIDGTAITTNYMYDSYNNPTQVTMDYSGQGSTLSKYTYSNNTGSTYYIGRLTKQEVTTTIGGNSFSGKEEYTYNGYLLSKLKRFGNNTPAKEEQYTYDAYGNITSVTLTPNNEQPRSFSFTYDSSKRFVTEQTDINGLTTTYNFNTDGTLKEEISPYEQKTSYEYDSFNRVLKQTDYLGQTATTKYPLQSRSNSISTVYKDGKFLTITYDDFLRIAKETYKNVDGQWVSANYEYDKFDRVVRQSEPYIGDAPTQWNTTEYDFYGRTIKQTLHTGRNITYSYSGLSVTVNDGTKTVTTTRDAMGNILQVTDPGGTINYTYHGNGNQKSAKYGTIEVLTEQDGWGQKTKLIDPSAGTYTYEYNGFGEIIKEITPKGETNYIYSNIGQLMQTNITGDANTNMETKYEYDPTTKLPTVVRLTTADGNNSVSTMVYDENQRLKRTIENNPHAQFIKKYTYDEYGRVYTEENTATHLATGKTSSVRVKNTYAYGALKTVTDFSTNEVLWNVAAVNARGQITEATFGTNLRLTNSYNSNGYLTEALTERDIQASPSEIMKLTFDFDAQRGLLKERTNSLFNWTETFTYDNLDRLTAFSDNAGNHTQTYDAQGKIDELSSLGTFSYASGSYQQIGLDLNTEGQNHYQNHSQQNISYNAFKRPVEINQAGTERIGFQYNALQQRSHMFYGSSETDVLDRRLRRHYAQDGSIEISHDTQNGIVDFVTYIGGDAYNAPAIYRTEHNGNNSTSDYLYLHRDYLGSILAITDTQGNLKEKRHFDAWGSIVKLTDGNNNSLSKFAYLDRGYTGHEHLQGIGLINMNARLYDPKLHRFLMPDNYIQDPFNTQNFNRYGYGFNNPLSYTDPSGEFFIEISLGKLLFGIATQILAIGAKAAIAFGLIDAFVGNGGGKSISELARPSPSSGQSSSERVSSSLGPASGEVTELSFGQRLSKASNSLTRISVAGLVGINASLKSSWEFVESLTTPQGWRDLGQGFKNAVIMADWGSMEGMRMRTQLAIAIGQFAERIPQMSDIELGYYGGYAYAQIIEGVLLSKGAGLTVNGLKATTKTIKGISKISRFANGPARTGSKNIMNVAEGGIPRIQNAANRINKPIHLVGSRANGTSRALSDFDYVIEGINNRQWRKIKNSLPGAPSRIDNLPRRIDLFRGPLDPSKPHITIYPN